MLREQQALVDTQLAAEAEAAAEAALIAETEAVDSKLVRAPATGLRPGFAGSGRRGRGTLL